MKRSEFFDQVAAGDDPLLFLPEHQAQVQALMARIGDGRGWHVCEPGCGAGPLTEHLLQWVGPTGWVDAFDSSPGMIARCRAAHGERANLRVWLADAESVEIEPESMDLIVLFRVFPHFDNKEAVLRRLRPALKPSGKLVIANLEGSRRLNELHAGFSEAVRHDHMPCSYGTRCLLENCGYKVLDAVDEERLFFVEAVLA